MKTLLATSLAAALSLGSLCAVAANTDTKPTASTVARENAPSEQPGTDAWITTKVKTELLTTKGIPSTDISVTTNNGVVTLTGVVDTKAQVSKSIACAKGIKGVQQVDASALTSRN